MVKCYIIRIDLLSSLRTQDYSTRRIKLNPGLIYRRFNKVKILGVWALLFSILLAPNLISPQKRQIDADIFNSLYIEGKFLFYKILRQNAKGAQIKDKDRKILLEAQSKLPGLYEHLMNFYYFHEVKIEEKDINFPSHFSNISKNMAEEFIQSIFEVPQKKETSSLQSLLYSTGYHSRKMVPIYRKFFRWTTNRARGQWALEELNVKEAHSLSEGNGIKLAIIDSGIDPTLREIKSRIMKWKNFLDSSKPIFDKGSFPVDWGGHGTSIASVIFQVTPKAELVIVKVSDNETMDTVPPTRWSAYLYAAGMIWAAQNGADIISLSAVFRENLKPIRDAVVYCWKKNVVIVTPLPNIPEENHENILYFPAVYPWTIAVGGVEKNDGKLKISEFSFKAKYIDVVAPASGVIVEMPSYLDRNKRARYAQGNSLAVPFVAGTSALILSAMDNQTLQKLKEKPGQLVETVRKILRKTSSNKKLGLKTPNPASGYGLINVQKAVQMAKNLKLKD